MVATEIASSETMRPRSHATRRGDVKRFLLGFGSLLLVGLLFFAILWNSWRAADQAREAERWHVHTLDVLLVAESLKAATHLGLRGERGYLITSDTDFLDPYYRSVRECPLLIEKLRQLTRDNPAQQRNIAQVDASMARYFTLLGNTIALERAGRGAQARKLVATGVGRERIEAVLHAIGRVENAERRLLAQRSATAAAAQARIGRWNVAMGGAALVSFLACFFSAWRVLAAHRKLAGLAEQLRISATTDELTQIPNRRSFLSASEYALAVAQRSGRPLSIAILDIDHFKRVNDTRGHAAGDEVLRAVARVLVEHARNTDIVARMGGEEFAVLMPDTDEDQARIACERLRGAVAFRRVDLPDGMPIAVTLSAGVAMLHPGEARDHLRTRADEALYQAKADGRNAVRLAA